jgi:hypothetical protein
MGYVTHALGTITIEPPLRWAQIKDSPFLPAGPTASEALDVALVLEEEMTETEDGAQVVRRAVGVQQRYEDEPRNYNIVLHLQRLIDDFPGHEFTGRFTCEGEENGDLWRLEVHDRKATKVRPRIVWPDGSETRTR